MLEDAAEQTAKMVKCNKTKTKELRDQASNMAL